MLRVRAHTHTHTQTRTGECRGDRGECGGVNTCLCTFLALPPPLSLSLSLSLALSCLMTNKSVCHSDVVKQNKQIWQIVLRI